VSRARPAEYWLVLNLNERGKKESDAESKSNNEPEVWGDYEGAVAYIHLSELRREV